MIRKGAAILGFVVGAYVGYTYALDLVMYYGIDTEDYWSLQGTTFIRIIFTVLSGAILSFISYFVFNLFSRFD